MTVTRIAYVYVPNFWALTLVLMPLLALSTFSGDVRFLMQMGLARPLR